MFGGGEFVIERHKHAASEKYGVRRNQPFGLIRHDDRGAVAGGKARLFKRGGQRFSALRETAGRSAGDRSRSRSASIRQTSSGQRSERIAQRRAQRFVLRQIKHQNCRSETEAQREAR